MGTISFRQRRQAADKRTEQDHELSSRHISYIEPNARHVSYLEPSTRQSVAPSVRSDNIYSDINEAEIQEEVTPSGNVEGTEEVTPSGNAEGREEVTPSGEANDETYVNQTQTNDGYERLRGRQQTAAQQ